MQSNRVFVVNSSGEPLMPCHPARARKLLKVGRAKIHRYQPFAIQLLDCENQDVQPVEVRVDPGSKTTGIALVAYGKRGGRVVWAAELQHRGWIIKSRLEKRSAVRRGRRHRKCRYRPKRFDNRKRNKFDRWLPPSLQSRVDNIDVWIGRLCKYAPLRWAAVETAKFDTQKMENPEISGIEYQRGTLAGWDEREYLLEKWGRRCVFCGAENVPLQVEHLIPKSRAGTSERTYNKAIACGPCNQKKGNQTAAEFGFPELMDKAKQSLNLRDAALMNSTRYAIGDAVKRHLPTTFWTGSRTKMNRINQGYPKAHWIDAACVGEAGADVFLPQGLRPLQIRAVGRGSRQMCRMDRYGFPRTGPKTVKRVFGFQTGDIVKADIPKGKYAGLHIGRISSVRASGGFSLKSVPKVNWKYCQLIQRADGYEYGWID